MDFIKSILLNNIEYIFFLMIVYILSFMTFTRIAIRDKSSLMIYSASAFSYFLYSILCIFVILYYFDSWILHVCLTLSIIVGGVFNILLLFKTIKDIKDYLNREPTDPYHYDETDYHPNRKDQFK